MAASTPTEPSALSPRPGGLRWGWILAGVLFASVLISLFLSVLLNGSRPRTGGFVILLSVVLAGILVGYHSRGETIRETAVAGLILVIVTGVISAVALDCWAVGRANCSRGRSRRPTKTGGWTGPGSW